MSILIFVLLASVLLALNMTYCVRRIVADVRQTPRAEVTLGALALSGAMMALAAMIWATLSSLAHL